MLVSALLAYSDQMDSEVHLLTAGLDRLRGLLGGLVVEPFLEQQLADSVRADALIRIRDPGGGGPAGTVLVEAKNTLVPADVARRLGPQVSLLRQLQVNAAVLVIAPWLSPRTRAVLDEHGYGYLDLTGNVSLRLERPTVVLRLQGREREPSGARKTKTSGVSGARAGQLIRLLVDAEPPYRAGQLADATGISLPWVGRVLDALEAELLIRRDGKTVTSTDWPGLLRARAGATTLLSANTVIPLLAVGGADRVLKQLTDDLIDPGLADQVAVTGSVAAGAVAPTAAAGQLMFYLRGGPPAANKLPERLGALRTEDTGRAPNVLVLLPPTHAVFDRTRTIDGVPHVALSQLVIDCLSGNGRMPAEGEAVLELMKQNESRWRLTHLPTSSDTTRTGPR